MRQILKPIKKLVVCTLLLVVTLLVAGTYFGLDSSQAVAPYQDTAISSTWRRTRYGWEDSSKWVTAKPIRFERRIELIHPLAISGIILLSSIGMLIWASEEWDTERLFSRSTKKSKPLA